MHYLFEQNLGRSTSVVILWNCDSWLFVKICTGDKVNVSHRCKVTCFFINKISSRVTNMLSLQNCKKLLQRLAITDFLISTTNQAELIGFSADLVSLCDDVINTDDHFMETIRFICINIIPYLYNLKTIFTIMETIS